jgi:thioredoxin-like negative regulator of GroEL
MKVLTVILLLMLVGSQAVFADIPVDWSTNYNDVLSSGGTNHAPALLYFTASWCGPCKLMSRTTLTDPAVIQALSNVDHVALDIDEHSDLASQFGVTAVPTLIMLYAGHEVDSATGYRPVGEFLGWLTNGVNEAQATAARLTRARTELADVDQLLGSTETNSTRLAATKLFDLCAQPESDVASSAVVRLRRLAVRDPVAVLDGVNDSRLAVRIQAANVLREAIGDSFDVDPWYDAAARLKIADVWRAKLSLVDRATR